MHAASVYPEPGSNSPKRCTTLRSRLLSEGLTARTSLSRISCHSSVVKVQRPRRDGPRRRRRMMRLGGRGVKPATRRTGVRTSRATSGRRHEGEWYGRAEACQTRARARRPAGQIGPVSTSRMKAAPPASRAARARPSRARRAGRRATSVDDAGRAARRCRPWRAAAGSR